jgi:DNA gyrase subunit A
MGRTATGVKGIALASDDEVVGMEISEDEDDILVVTKNGYGKRTPVEDYRIQTRGGKGLKTCNITEKNGDVVALKSVNLDDDLMLITVHGVLIRVSVEDISQTGRNTQGVKLIRLGDDEYVSTVARVQSEDEDLDEELDEEGEHLEGPQGEETEEQED